MKTKKYIKAAGESFFDTMVSFGRFMLNVLKAVVSSYGVVFPYFCLWLGQHCYRVRGNFSIGSEWGLPVIVFIVFCYSKKFLKRIGKGSSIPVPESRFTNVDEDGEINVDKKRIEELLVYMADLEDWLERNHRM